MKIHLYDTFNDKLISRHNSIKAAVSAQRKHARAVRRRNGVSSYVTYAFRFEDGSAVDGDEIMEAKYALDFNR